jgi:hypothetical protein
MEGPLCYGGALGPQLQGEGRAKLATLFYCTRFGVRKTEGRGEGSYGMTEEEGGSLHPLRVGVIDPL